MTTFQMTSPLVPPPGVQEPLSIPAPVEVAPIKLRKALRLMRKMRSPQSQTEEKVQAGVEFFEAVGGLGGERTFHRFSRCPEGRRLLRTRPDLVAILADREALAEMPEGSLGRAYLAFAQENGFAADGLVQKSRDAYQERKGHDAYRDWFWDRFTLAHDLWHVLAGCATTEDGEIRLLAFSYAQTPQRGFLILLCLAAAGRMTDVAHHARQWRAWRAGRRAHDLVSLPWESYLAWPLEEVRRCYGVEVLER